MSEEQGSTGELGILTPIKLLVAVAFGMVILAVFGYALNGVFLFAERRLLHWHASGQSST